MVKMSFDSSVIISNIRWEQKFYSLPIAYFGNENSMNLGQLVAKQARQYSHAKLHSISSYFAHLSVQNVNRVCLHYDSIFNH